MLERDMASAEGGKTQEEWTAVVVMGWSLVTNVTLGSLKFGEKNKAEMI